MIQDEEEKSKIIVESASFACDITAFVEDDEETLYFYLYGPQEAIPQGVDLESFVPVRACFLANKKIQNQDRVFEVSPLLHHMREGQSASVPHKSCAYFLPAELNPTELEVVFLEEGDSAALFYQNKLIAFIPTWGATQDNTIAYSAGLASEFMGMKPLSELPQEFLERIEAARKFWASWLQEEGEEKGVKEEYFITHYNALYNSFGEHAYYAPLETEKWPPKVVYIFEKQEATIFATVGTSILAQPRLEPYTAESKPLRRFELGMAFSKEVMQHVSLEYIVGLMRDISFAPWFQLMWFGQGHALLYPLALPKNQKGEPFTALLFTKEELHAPKPQFPPYQGDAINFLWATPITESEFHYHASLNEKEAAAPTLLQLLQEKKTSWVHTNRNSVI